MANKKFTFVTGCHNCGKYWNTMTEKQAKQLFHIHKQENELHEIFIKNLDTEIILLGISPNNYQQKIKEKLILVR